MLVHVSLSLLDLVFFNFAVFSQGLLNFAFDPSFESNGFFYLSYTVLLRGEVRQVDAPLHKYFQRTRYERSRDAPKLRCGSYLFKANGICIGNLYHDQSREECKTTVQLDVFACGSLR